MKERFRKDYDLFWSDKTDKSLTYCIYKNGNITKIYFCVPCSNGGVLVIMRTITGNILEPEINCFSNTFIFMISEKQTSLQFDQSHKIIEK